MGMQNIAMSVKVVLFSSATFLNVRITTNDCQRSMCNHNKSIVCKWCRVPWC